MDSVTASPVHGTAVAVAGRGVLILGRSGSGKSALALEMMALGAVLVSDDQVVLRRSAKGVVMDAPVSISGRIEARHVGILQSPNMQAPLHLVVDMDLPRGPRLPEGETLDVLQCRMPLIRGKDVPALSAALTVLLRDGTNAG